MPTTTALRFNDLGVEGGDLRAWAWVFFRCPSPRVIAPVLAAAAITRLVLASWRWTDLIVAAAFVAAEPFTEWLLHVFVLHFKPRTLGGRRLDPYMARKHRAHHVDPQQIGLVFVQMPALVALLVLVLALVLLGFRNAQLAMTAEVTATALLLLYEWTHFLIHSPYRPRTAVYRYIWRAHRLHHFKNEHYWFGITSHVADWVLQTFPDKAAVETSPTARTLAWGDLRLRPP